jgi:DNA-binding CsgD family transcriptional regulator
LIKDLTDGERRVLRAYVEDEKHDLAAARLGISTQTLKNHLGHIYRKVGVHKAHAAIYQLAMQRGVDPLAPLTEAGRAGAAVAPSVTRSAEMSGKFSPTEALGSSMLDQNTHEDTDPSPLAEMLEQPDPTGTNDLASILEVDNE